MEKTTYLRFSIFAILVLSGLAASPFIAQAATLYFSPSSGTHVVDTTFSVNVHVSSVDQAMNAASGVVSFPRDTLEVLSLSKSGSIFALWVQEPAFSNTLGTVSFEGIVLNPGFTGAAGRILTVSFRVKAVGSGFLRFASGSVLANDGQGTNILTGMSGAEFSLGAAPAPTPTPTPTPQPRVGVPSAPVVRSATHVDSEKWYANNAPVFSWDVPDDVTTARLLVGESPSSVPNIVYSPAISSRDLSDISLADGVWYFHVQLRNASGYGGTSHFRFQIDTAKPSFFNLQEQARADAIYPKVSFAVDATDETSGIDRYEFQIDDGEAQVWRDPGNHVYETAALAPGKHELIAKAVDRAGNYLVDSASFVVEPITTPTITEYPQVLKTGELFVVGGVSLPGGTVTLFVQRGKEDVMEYTADANDSGAFAFLFDEGLRDAGTYEVWAKVTDVRGAQSLPTEKVSLLVERSAFIELGSWATTVLSVVVPIVALALVLFALLWYGWHKFMTWKRRIRKEVREAESALHKAFDMLKKDIRGQVKLLEKTKTKRQLTKEEEKIIKQLRKNLDDAEKFVRKEIEDIEKAMK